MIYGLRDVEQSTAFQGAVFMKAQRESGMALLTVMLILILISGLIAGMSWMVMTDQRLSGNSYNFDLAFYGAEAGMEKLTADIGNQFATEGAITATDVTNLQKNPPSMIGISFTNAAGHSTYLIECGTTLPPCTPASSSAQILPPSPYAGMNAIITPFTLSVTADQFGGGEVKLNRQLQLVSIPVFQFGVYSDTDLAFFNGPKFDFGGRTHTNGNLWLAPNSGPLFMGDKVTVVGQVIRTNLENGYPLGSTLNSGTDYSGVASIARTPNPSTPPSPPSYSNTQWRPLGLGESSVTGSSVYGNVSTVPNDPTWPNVESAYNGMLINHVSPLSLTSSALGGLNTPISLIRRATLGERASNPSLFSRRYFSQGTIRILLDDYPGTTSAPGTPGLCHSADMMSLDGIDTTSDPVDLASLITKPVWWGTSPETFYALPTSGASATSYASYAYPAQGNGYWISAGSPIVTGCIKIEYQDNANPPAWHDITQTVLKLGFAGRNIDPIPSSASPPASPTLPFLPHTGTIVSAQGSASISTTAIATIPCTDPNPNAIIRIARVRDNPTAETTNGCGTPSTTSGTDFWPMALFDSREGTLRPGQPVTTDSDGNPQIPASGVMYYIELDAVNLANWLRTNQPVLNLNNNTGYGLYFSDRRGEQLDNQITQNAKTGSFGYNDFVNPSSVNNGCPDGALNTGEDLEGDGLLRTFGGIETLPYSTYQLSNIIGGSNYSTVLVSNPNCATAGIWPGLVFLHTQEARENPPVFFRRALKIVDGQTLNLGTTCFTGGTPACGLAISAENPVYIMGDYNVPGLSMSSASSVATSVAGDAVTLLSDAWNDVNSFISPYDCNSRNAVTTDYRVALIGGKGQPFQQIGTTEDFGTDGGLHNFLRFLENWGNSTANYSGSLVSFYYYRQAVGTYKNNAQVYSPPNRVYFFDTNFTKGTQYLPPLTPDLRSINTIGFTQEINPTQ
jgi:hypothetical protein